MNEIILNWQYIHILIYTLFENVVMQIAITVIINNSLLSKYNKMIFINQMHSDNLLY